MQSHAYERSRLMVTKWHDSAAGYIVPVVLLLGERHCKLGVGSSGVSGKMKGAVRRTESQSAAVGGGRNGRKGAAAMSAR